MLAIRIKIQACFYIILGLLAFWFFSYFTCYSDSVFNFIYLDVLNYWWFHVVVVPYTISWLCLCAWAVSLNTWLAGPCQLLPPFTLLFCPGAQSGLPYWAKLVSLFPMGSYLLAPSVRWSKSVLVKSRICALLLFLAPPRLLAASVCGHSSQGCIEHCTPSQVFLACEQQIQLCINPGCAIRTCIKSLLSLLLCNSAIKFWGGDIKFIVLDTKMNPSWLKENVILYWQCPYGGFQLARCQVGISYSWYKHMEKTPEQCGQ